MSDQQFSQEEHPVRPVRSISDSLRGYYPHLLLAAFFVGALWFRPDLFWGILLATGTGFAALWLANLNGVAPDGNRSYGRRISRNAGKTDFGRNYLAIMNSLQFPVFLLDNKASIRFYNQKAASAFGKIRVGERILTRFRQPGFRSNLGNVLATGNPASFPYNEPVPDDRWYLIEFSKLPDGERRGGEHQDLYLLAFHDQTEMRRIDRMRSDFIANASHELRTPLASLLGYIETIRGPAKNDPNAQERFTGTMLEQAERMSRLVNDLLSLSRIEMKAHVRPAEEVSLRDVLVSVISSLEALATQLEVGIRLEMEDDRIVNGDRDELIQVFQNLVENGCKYGDEGKEVIVSVSDAFSGDKQKTLVTVRDFGPGIPIEHQHRITERFYRIDVARSREKQGTGLGLAIVKHILNRHGTRLNVKSQPGEGAEFSVMLDVAGQSTDDAK